MSVTFFKKPEVHSNSRIRSKFHHFYSITVRFRIYFFGLNTPQVMHNLIWTNYSLIYISIYSLIYQQQYHHNFLFWYFYFILLNFLYLFRTRNIFISAFTNIIFNFNWLNSSVFLNNTTRDISNLFLRVFHIR